MELNLELSEPNLETSPGAAGRRRVDPVPDAITRAGAAVSPGLMEDLSAARRRFLRTGEVEASVRPMVRQAWARCIEYGVDPERMPRQSVVPEEFEQARARNRHLLACAEPYVNLLHETLENHPHIIAISDAEARILRLLSDEESVAHGQDVNFFEGASWHERDIGCNGIGTSLATGTALILIGPEHFQQAHVDWTCIGIPLHGEDGEILGALDLSVPNEHIQTHTWGWVLSIAQLLERDLKRPALRAHDDSQSLGDEPIPASIREPFQTVRGVLELVASQVNLYATHADLLAEAGEKARAAEERLHALAAEMQARNLALTEKEIELQRAHEVAHQRAAEAHERARLLDAIMRYVPEGITIAEAPDVVIRMVSDYGRTLSGRDAGALQGVAAEDHPERWGVLHADGVTPARSDELPLTRATRNGEVVSNEEWVIQRPDGTQVPVLCNAGPILDREGNITGGIIAWRDISEQRLAQVKLRSMNERLEQRVAERTASLEQRTRDLQSFAFVASHDLQEPLRKIRTFSTLMQHDYGDRLDEAGMLFLDRIERAAMRMSRLLSDVLTFSRMETHIHPFERVQIGDVVSEVLDDLEIAIGEAQAEIEVDVPHVLEADPNQLRQLLSQLVLNAIKFRRDGVRPLVRISASPARMVTNQDAIRLVVEDNGIGFDRQYAEHIFDPFRRLHGRGEYEGTGMGLAICRRIVERHEGVIKAESTPGVGSRFEVLLPVNPRGLSETTV